MEVGIVSPIRSPSGSVFATTEIKQEERIKTEDDSLSARMGGTSINVSRATSQEGVTIRPESIPPQLEAIPSRQESTTDERADPPQEPQLIRLLQSPVLLRDLPGITSVQGNGGDTRKAASAPSDGMEVSSSMSEHIGRSYGVVFLVWLGRV